MPSWQLPVVCSSPASSGQQPFRLLLFPALSLLLLLLLPPASSTLSDATSASPAADGDDSRGVDSDKSVPLLPSQLPPSSADSNRSSMRSAAAAPKNRRSSAASTKKRLYIDGDVIVGALFSMHKQPPRGGGSGQYVGGSDERACGEIWEQYGMHRIETFLMTLDRINRDPHILPDVELGCDVRDSCWDVQMSLSECKHYIRTSLVHELDYSSSSASASSSSLVATAGMMPAADDDADRGFATAADGGGGNRCIGPVGGTGAQPSYASGSRDDSLSSKPIAVLIGAGSSQVSMQVQDMLQLFSIPQLDYSTSSDLSDKSRYRYFLRVAPPDSQQATALADFVEHFGWTYISTVYTDGTYGSSGMDIFNKIIRSRGICVATADHVSSVDSDQRYDEVIRNMQKTPNAKVIVCFCEGATVSGLFKAMKRLNENGFFIVGSDGWNTRPDVVLDVHDVAVGSFSIKMDSPEVPGFDDYFFGLRPQNNTRNPWFDEFWEFRFRCDLPRSDGSPPSQRKYNRTCTGAEDLRHGYDVDAKLGFVVNAMYAMALGLDAMQRDLCGTNRGRLCDAMLPLNGSMLLQYLKRVNFTTYSSQALFFNENGDPPGKYLYMNYQLVDGAYAYKQVGSWEAGTFNLNESTVQWRRPAAPPHVSPGAGNQSDGSVYPAQLLVLPPESVCSYPCAHGSVKKAQPQLSRCCWLCEKCPENAILPGNETCSDCPPGWWPDANLTVCHQLPITYIRWRDMDAALPLTLASIGMALTVATLIVFARHNRTAVVKASTRELSYLMLVGIALAHLSTLAFFARPTVVSCYLTRILPGLSFSLVYGAVLTKTNRIARILSRSKRIALDKPRCMTTGSLVAVTAGLVAVEAAVSAAMLAWQPADAVVAYPDGGRRALLVCNTSAYGVLAPLGFDFLLIVLCTFYAVKTRNVPANFNEAKFIGFAMYTTCVIWIGFVAIYFGSDSKVMTITMSITLSATVSLVLLFGQKVYIIVWKPEKNHRSAFTTTTKDVRCHIGSSAASAIECSARLITANYTSFSRNGTFTRNNSSGSLNSSSSRLVALRQKNTRASVKSSGGGGGGGGYYPAKSRDPSRHSASTPAGPSSPDSSNGLQPLCRPGPLWEEDDDSGSGGGDRGEIGIEMRSLSGRRSVACQTEFAEKSFYSATAATDGVSILPGDHSSLRLRRISGRVGAGSSCSSTKEMFSSGNADSSVVDDEERRPLLVPSSATLISAIPAVAEVPKVEISRSPRLIDATTNQLDVVREEADGGCDPLPNDESALACNSSSSSMRPTFAFGSSELLRCDNVDDGPSSGQPDVAADDDLVLNSGLVGVGAIKGFNSAKDRRQSCADGHLQSQPAYLDTGHQGSAGDSGGCSCRTRRSTMPRPESGRQWALCQSKSWASDGNAAARTYSWDSILRDPQRATPPETPAASALYSGSTVATQRLHAKCPTYNALSRPRGSNQTGIE